MSTQPAELARDPSRRQVGRWARALISLVLLAIIVSRIEPQIVIRLIGRVHLHILALAAGLLGGQLIVAAFTLRFLVDRERRLAFPRFFTYYCFAWAAGLVSLGRTGEFSISYYLKKEGIPYSKSLAIVLLDKLVTLAVFISVAIAGTAWFFGTTQPLLLVFDAAVLAGLLFLCWFLMTARLPGARWVARLPRLQALAERRRENFATFRGHFRTYFHLDRTALLRNLGGTLIKLGIMSLNGSVLFLAIDSSINPFYMMFIITIAAIAALIPITLSGLGVVEATYIFLAGLVGIPAETAIATEVMMLMLNYGLALLIAIVWTRAS